MGKYIREIIQILSLTLLIFVFPNLVLAAPTKLPEIIQQKITRMSLEEKVGQLFIVGFPQKSVTPELEKFISTYRPGSFLLFKRNIQSIEQVSQLNTALYRASFKHSRLPPLIAIDQEGGSVSRLPISPAPPNALSIGQTQSPLIAEELGFQTGLFLREAGFNMNLAPVLDVADPFSGSFIGVRSFGADPHVVSDLGVAYSKGLLRARVIPTAKHFPGTGNLHADPHVGIVQNLSSFEALKTQDLKPYEAYSSLGKNVAVMLSHLIYPALDDTREPASFSKKISTGLLRDDLKYQGLVVTDDLQMQGSRQFLRPEAAALKALQAGADVVMLTWSFKDQGKAFEFVKAAIKRGDLSEDDLNQKLHRILTVKAFANLYRRDPQLPSLRQGVLLTSPKYAELESTVLDLNLKTNLLPRELPAKEVAPSRKPAATSKVCVLSPSSTFIRSFLNSSPRVTASKHLSGSLSKEEVLFWMKENKCPRSLVTITGVKTAALVKSLPRATKQRLVVVNLGAPRLLKGQRDYLRTLQLYFNHQESGKKIALHLEEILDSSAKSYVLK
ncbi:glycoside hydrolase family 3 protein [Bdellovibrio sp.]|uniref:glycoside hydrolase family 3 protein n=1 Tax=Bdellovibrio sp. TaxID=28201 RepID=UPI0039E4160F